MADEQTTNQTTSANADSKKPKTVMEAMPSRTIKNNVEEASAFIKNAFTAYSDFGDHEIISPIDAARKDAEGNSTPVAGLSVKLNEAGEPIVDDKGIPELVFDPVIFPPEMRIMVSVLTQRGEGQGSSTVKAIVVAPVPTFEAILNDQTGQQWLNKIVETELNRAAVRVLRPTDADVNDVSILDQMPKTLSDYVQSNRGGSSTLLQAFEEFWKPIKQGLGKLSKAWKLHNLSKKELKNAMSSKAYASQYYPTLEETKKGSLFEFAIGAFIAQAKQAGMDYTIFEQWKANRDQHVIDESEEDEDEELSLDALTAAMVSNEEATPPAPTANPDAPATGEANPEAAAAE